MTWLFESPFTIFMTGLLFVGMLSAAAFMLANTTSEDADGEPYREPNSQWRKVAYAAVLVGILTVGLVIFERVTVTDNEQLKSIVYDLADAVRNNDVNGVLKYTSEEYPLARSKVRSEMPDYDFASCSIAGFRELSIDRTVTPNKAKVEFVAWINGRAKRGDRIDGTGRRAVLLNFIQEKDGRWCFYDYQHYEPMSRAY